MLSPLARIALKIRHLRRQRRWSQRELARRVGCSQAYLCQVECGIRPPSLRLTMACARALQIQFPPARYLRGRPPRPRGARALVAGPPPPRRPDFPPFHPRPDRERRPRDILWEIGPKLGREAELEARALERERPDDESFWRLWNSLRFDSWPEKRLALKVALTRAPLFNLRLDASGCALQVNNGKTGRTEPERAHPAFILQHRRTTIAWFTQLCVRTPVGHRWPDNVLVLSRSGQTRTLVVEVDGEPHHRDRRRQLQRDQELGVPVLHLCSRRIGEPGILSEILDWAEAA